MKNLTKIIGLSIGAFVSIAVFLALPINHNVGQYFPPSSGGGTPGGSNTQVQYNNSSAFGGITGATSDGTNLLVTTQGSTDNSTKTASTAYVTTAVSNAIAGVNPAVATQAGSNAVLPNSPTYSNGVSGVGATLTGGSNAALVVDGYSVAANDRILVKDQASTFQNGVYVVTQVGSGILPYILTRASDYNSPSNINNTGAIPVINGTANTSTSWVLTSSVATVGTDALTFTEFSLNPTTIALKSGTLAQFASTSSSQLLTLLSDETGTGLSVFGTAPTFASTMTIGTASGTTGAINFKGTTSGTAVLTVGAAAGTPTLTLPTATGTLATLAGSEIFTNKSIVGTQLTGTAYTFAANNTNGTAAYTLNAFEDHPLATYAGTIAWNGTAPTTIVSQQYAWSRIGDTVTLMLNIEYTNAGVTNTQVSFSLPSDCPTPVTIAGFGDAANETPYTGTGRIEASTTANPGASRAFLKKNAANNGYDIFVISASSSAKAASFSISYRTS